MKLPDWVREHQAWDAYKAFHIGVHQHGLQENNYSYRTPPFVMFDTGEVIFTDWQPRPDNRGSYSLLDVEVCTSTEYRGELYAPGGDKIAIAWLYDNGMEYLLVDDDTKRVVSMSYNSDPRKGIGGVIPHRLQGRASVYFPGPGMAPVGTKRINVWLPFNKIGLDKDQKAHVQMIIDTARAAMKLTDHPHTRTHASTGIMAGCPLDTILKCQTWQDVPEANLAELFHNGAQRKKVEYDYLLTEKP
jgi:hypothetical protein